MTGTQILIDKEDTQDQNGNADTFPVYFRINVQYSYCLKIRICITVEGCHTAKYLEQPEVNSSFPPSVRVILRHRFFLEPETTTIRAPKIQAPSGFLMFYW